MLFRWYATTRSVTETTPKLSSQPEPALDAQRPLDVRRRLLLRLRVPVAGERLDDGAACGEVELADEVRLAEMEVDAPSCTVEYARSCSTRPSSAPVLASITVNASAEAERSGARAAGSSFPAQTQPRGVCRSSGTCGGALERLVAERRAVVVVHRRLERGRGDVAVEHARVRVVEDRRLDTPAEQRLGLAHEVLVERVLRCDEHREAVSAAAGASPLLAEARHRAGEADGDGAVEQADVDPELERIGGGDAEQLALDEPPLDVAPLLRRVAGAVRREPLRGLRVDALQPRSDG